MATIGFLSPDIAPYSSEPVAENTASAETPVLFTFDDNDCIHMHEAVRSTLILGSTGSGKTHSLILPMLDKLIGAGYGGVVIDVKGNLGEHVYNLAALHGREAHVLEIGSGPAAMSLNLLEGMSSGERRAFFHELSMIDIAHDHNVSWFAKGGVLASDVADVLEVLSRCPALGGAADLFRPTLERVYLALTDWNFALAIWELGQELLRSGDIPEGSEEAMHFEDIRNQHFHVFSCRAKDPADTDFQNQLTWMLQGITKTFAQLKNTENLLSRFSSTAPDAPTLDFGREVYQNNHIVLVHFSPACGGAGEILSRLCKGRSYAAMYARGLQLPQDRYTFFVGDEFQAIINVDDSCGNDFDLFSVSREFRNINIIATQSLASLYARSKSTYRIDSLLSNCMNVVCMQSTDTVTQKNMKEYYGADVLLSLLRSGECVYRRYNDGERCTTVGMSSVNTAFTETRERLHEGRQRRAATPLSPVVESDPVFPRELRKQLIAALPEKPNSSGRGLVSGGTPRKDKPTKRFIQCIWGWNARFDVKPAVVRAPSARNVMNGNTGKGAAMIAAKEGTVDSDDNKYDAESAEDGFLRASETELENTGKIIFLPSLTSEDEDTHSSGASSQHTSECLQRQAARTKVNRRELAMEDLSPERDAVPPLQELAKAAPPASECCEQALVNYQKAMADAGKPLPEEAMRWFAAFFKWSDVCRDKTTLESYVRAMNIIAGKSVEQGIPFVSFDGNVWEGGPIPAKAEKNGLVLPDLTWPTLMAMSPETLHQTLLHRSAFLLSCCCCGLGDHETWDALTERCVPTAEAACAALRVVHSLHTAGTQGYAALRKAVLGESAFMRQRLCAKIVEWAQITPNITVVDPYCGDGSMMVEAHRYLRHTFDYALQSPGVLGYVGNSGVPVAEMHLRLAGLSPQSLLYHFSETPLRPEWANVLSPAAETVDVVISCATELPGKMPASNLVFPVEGESRQEYVRRFSSPSVLALFAVYRALALLRPGGRAVLAVPAAFEKAQSRRLQELHDDLSPHRYSFEPLPDMFCTETGQPLSLLCLRKQG